MINQSAHDAGMVNLILNAMKACYAPEAALIYILAVTPYIVYKLKVI